MFGFKLIRTGSREHLENVAEDILLATPHKDLVKKEMDRMTKEDLRAFVEKHRPEELEG